MGTSPAQALPRTSQAVAELGGVGQRKMNLATSQRDHLSALAKSDSLAARAEASRIEDPWFRAQAFAWVARFAENEGIEIARDAAKAASACDDSYKRCAAKAWEIAALAELGALDEAAAALELALVEGRLAQPLSSRAEALFLLAQAAASISLVHRDRVCDLLVESCSGDKHWRCKRAIRDVGGLRDGTQKSRSFFW
jgi:hypothetical protein